MSRASTILLVLGLILAVVSGAGMYVLLTNAQPQPVSVATSKVVIAFQNIPARTEITADQVGEADWPQTVPTPTGAFQDVHDVIGKLSLVAIYQGEPILDKMVIDKSQLKETHSNAALILDKGTVAVALPVSIRTNVAEAVQPGDRVDIFATFPVQANGSTAPLTTQRLLSDVLILQVGPWPPPNATGQTATNTSILTLLLKEQDALVLEYTQQNASGFTLALRPANDHNILPLEPVTLDYIIQHYNYVPGR